MATHFAAPLVICSGHGLVVTTVDSECGPLYWNLAKNGAEHMTRLMAKDFLPHNVAIVTLGPGWMRNELILRNGNVTEETWQQNDELRGTESPRYVGRAVVALACDPNALQKTGKGWHSGDLAEAYGFTDIDGTQPNWSRFWKETHPDANF